MIEINTKPTQANTSKHLTSKMQFPILMNSRDLNEFLNRLALDKYLHVYYKSTSKALGHNAYLFNQNVLLQMNHD
jgi:hypothetical protein